MPDPELVLGAPRDRLWSGPWWRGLRVHGIEHIVHVGLEAATFRPRAEAEIDPTWKQLIPYLVLRDGPRIFLFVSSAHCFMPGNRSPFLRAGPLHFAFLEVPARRVLHWDAHG